MSSKRTRVGLVVSLAALAVAVALPPSSGARPPAVLYDTVDTGLCAFPFEATGIGTQRNHVTPNVFFTNGNRHADYVFRVLPNLSLGYNLLNHTSIYCNYFVIKDVYAVQRRLTFPTTQSLSLGLRQDIPINRKTSADALCTAHLDLPGIIDRLAD